MLAAILALAPLVLELLKLIWGSKGSEADQAKAVKEAEDALRAAIARVRAAIDAVPEKGTEDLERIINEPRK